MAFERREASWLSFAEAKRRILLDAGRRLLPAEKCPVGEALGRALGEGVRSAIVLPPWDNSAMDGYAVRGADVLGASPEAPIELAVVGAVRPGGLPEKPVGRGEAIRIMTGGIIPAGADTVVRVEDTDAEGVAGRVVVRADRDRNRNIRPAGEDLEKGASVLEPGTTISPAHLGILAALGIDELQVRARPRVAILSNGDELIPADEGEAARARGAVVDTNSPALAAAVRAAGAIPIPLGIVPDDGDAIRSRLAEASDADVIVTSGGASMGEADLFKRVLDEMGFELDFWRVRLRPGSPFSFGHLPVEGRRGAASRPVPLFGLPGNPVSAYVTFELLVRPFLLSVAGHRRVERPTLPVRAAEPLTASGAQTIFMRVVLAGSANGEWLVRPTGAQGSGLLSSIARADALAVIPEGIERIEAGDRVDIVLLGEGPGWPGDPTPETGA